MEFHPSYTKFFEGLKIRGLGGVSFWPSENKEMIINAIKNNLKMNNMDPDHFAYHVYKEGNVVVEKIEPDTFVPGGPEDVVEEILTDDYDFNLRSS